MGLSGSKQTSTSKPIYENQITGAANNISSAYSGQQPKMTGITDSLASLVPGLVEQYNKGDPNVTAARNYNTDVLGGKYLDEGNPYLEDMVSRSNSDVSNRLSASLGTRGLTNGSDFTNIIARAVADNGTQLRFNNYNTERGRMDSAAALAPSLSSAQYAPLAPIFDILSAQSAPVQAATGAGAGIGGLLGNYTNNTTKNSQSLGSIITQLAASGAAGWASGGFKGI